jgi:hypothetical protein
MKQALSQRRCQSLKLKYMNKNKELGCEEGVRFCGDCVDARGDAGMVTQILSFPPVVSGNPSVLRLPYWRVFEV